MCQWWIVIKTRHKGKLELQKVDGNYEFFQEEQLDFHITISNEHNLGSEDALLQQSVVFESMERVQLPTTIADTQSTNEEGYDTSDEEQGRVNEDGQGSEDAESEEAQHSDDEKW